MRIYDSKNKQSLSEILIMLTSGEVHELIGSLRSLNPLTNDHVHVSDESYKREITIGVFTPGNTGNFSDDVIQLIEEDD
jgi:hypothetical protein